MKERWTSVGVLVALVALAWLLLMHLLLLASGWPEFRSLIAAVGRTLRAVDTPAWVQAIGSIGAILFSVAMVAWQQASARAIAAQHKKEADIAFVMACASLSASAARTLRDIARKTEAKIGQRLILSTERLEQLQVNFQPLLSKDMPPRALQLMIIVQRELAYALTAANRVRKTPVTVSRAERAAQRAKVVRSVAIKLHDIYKEWGGKDHVL